MSYDKDSAQPVGKATRGEVYRDLCLVSELLDLVNNSLSGDEAAGISAATEISQKMILDLATKVSP